jgi:hypothetical protein
MSLLSRFVGVFRSERVNREIEEEHEFHIGCRIAELIEEGVTPEAAARRARLEFGNRVRTREESHDASCLAGSNRQGKTCFTASARFGNRHLSPPPLS